MKSLNGKVYCDYCYRVASYSFTLNNRRRDYKIFMRNGAEYEFCSLHCKISWKGQYPKHFIFAKNGWI